MTELQRKEIQIRLRTFMYNQSPGCWNKYYGSQLEGDIVSFTEQETEALKKENEQLKFQLEQSKID